MTFCGNSVPAGQRMHHPRVIYADSSTIVTCQNFAMPVLHWQPTSSSGIVCTGALGVPFHWSMKSESRAVCLCFAPPTAGSGEGSPWSHPLKASFPGGVDRHVAIPVQPPTPSQTATPGAGLPAVIYQTSRSPHNVCQQAVLLSTCCCCETRAQSDPQPHWEAECQC